VACEPHAQALADRCDRFLQVLVGEGMHLAAPLIDEMMVVAFRVGDLISCDAVPAVQSVQKAELEQLIEDPVDRRRRPDAGGAQLIGDFLRTEQALALSRQELHNGGARGAGPQTGAGEAPFGSLEPTISELRVDSRSLP